jgi:hypothetical protein
MNSTNSALSHKIIENLNCKCDLDLSSLIGIGKLITLGNLEIMDNKMKINNVTYNIIGNIPFDPHESGKPDQLK